MGHTEITESPGKRGSDCQCTVGRIVIRTRNIGAHHAQIAGKSLCIGDYMLKAACCKDTEADDDNERYGHRDTLDQIGRADRQKTAQRAVKNDDRGTDE